MERRLTARLTWISGLLLALLAGPGAASEVGPALGSVAAHEGDVVASGPDGLRPLGCGDLVHTGEHLRTGGDGRLTVMVGGSVLRLGPGADLELAGAPEAPELLLQRGRAWVAPSMVEGAALRASALSTPHLRVEASAAHLEVVVRPDRGQSVACAFGEAARVVLPAGGRRLVLAPGECAVGTAGEILARRPGSPAPLASAATVCTAVASRDLFEPADVAAGLQFAALAPPGGGGGNPIQPCDTGLCQGPPPEFPKPPAGGIRVLESPATPFDPGLLPRPGDGPPVVESPATPFDPGLLGGGVY